MLVLEDYNSYFTLFSVTKYKNSKLMNPFDFLKKRHI